MIELVCDKNRAFFRETEKLTSGSIGVTINFVFSPEWDGLLKTVVFDAGEAKIDVVLTSESCEVPPEVLACPGKQLSVGVFGELADKTLVIPTIYAKAGIIRPGASPSGLSSAPPTPSWPEQVQAIALEAKEAADSVRSDAEAGKFAGPAGEAGGYYTPAVTQPDENTLRVAFTPSKEDMPAVADTDIPLSAGGNGLTAAQINALDGMFKVCAFIKADISAEYNEFCTAFGIEAATITGISATYSGGSVPAGTALDDLTGIVVTAQYSDGSTATVTGYTLSGEIAEGSNTITVTYQDKTATFTVTGTAVSQVYTVTNNLTNATNSNSNTTASGFYSATLTVVDGYSMNSVVITMGGVDITDSVYGEGSISITEVTGDIVITAVAAELQQINTESVYADVANLYSDNGATKIGTKYYLNGFATLNATETEAEITVKITNISEGSVSCSAYLGSGDIVNLYYTSNKSISLAVGGSVEYVYIVRAGYKFTIAGIPKDSVSVSVFGAFDVFQPTAEYPVENKYFETIKTYSDGTTDTLLKSANYQCVVCTSETFTEDTDLIVTLVGGESDVLFTGTEWYFGSAKPTSLNAVYYGVKKGGANATVKAGQVIKYTYTVKAGYAFAISNVTAALTADMVYVEKA